MANLGDSKRSVGETLSSCVHGFLGLGLGRDGRHFSADQSLNWS